MRGQNYEVDQGKTSISGVGKTGQSCTKIKLTPLPAIMHKRQIRWIKYLNSRPGSGTYKKILVYISMTLKLEASLKMNHHCLNSRSRDQSIGCH